MASLEANNKELKIDLEASLEASKTELQKDLETQVLRTEEYNLRKNF